MEATKRPEDILHTIRGLDGRRVPDVSDETYQRALKAAEKVIKDGYRILRESIEREKSGA